MSNPPAKRDQRMSHSDATASPRTISAGHTARRLFTATSAAALLMSMLVCAVWIASLMRSDTIGWAGFDNRSADTWHTWGVSISRGQLTLYRMQTGTARIDDSPRQLDGQKWPAMQPHAFHHVDRASKAWSRKPIDALHVSIPGSPFQLRFVGFAFWFIAIPLGLAASPFAVQQLKSRAARRRPPGSCKSCGLDLRASAERCPECGVVISPI